MEIGLDKDVKSILYRYMMVEIDNLGDVSSNFVSYYSVLLKFGRIFAES